MQQYCVRTLPFISDNKRILFKNVIVSLKNKRKKERKNKYPGTGSLLTDQRLFIIKKSGKWKLKDKLILNTPASLWLQNSNNEHYKRIQ